MVWERRRSRIDLRSPSARRGVQEELIKYFCAGVPARAAAEVSGVNRNTAILLYHKLREVILDALARAASPLGVQVRIVWWRLNPGHTGGQDRLETRPALYHRIPGLHLVMPRPVDPTEVVSN